MKHLGRPLPNAALLGGFAALSGLITLDAVAHATIEINLCTQPHPDVPCADAPGRC